MTSLHPVSNNPVKLPAPFCFVFVCQSGELEIKATLLAASLRRQFGHRVDLVAAVPQPEARWGKISDTTRTLLEQLGVRLIQVFNRVNEEYGYANKIDCLNVKTTAAKTIFLDSDILCLRPVSDDAFPAVFNAKAADLPTWSRSEICHRLNMSWGFISN
jgi:hypothetical protein